MSGVPSHHESILNAIAFWIALGANAVTIVIGVGMLIGFIWKRDKISLIVRLYLNNHFSQRARKISENIERVKQLNYADKGNRAEVVSLLHAVRGQLRPWLVNRKALQNVFQRLDDVVEKRIRLNEATKMEIAHELSEVIEGMFLSDLSAGDAK